MTLDPRSFALGFLAAYAFSIAFFAVLVGVPYALDRWKARKSRKEWDEAVDRMLVNVAVRCIERPTNVRLN